MTAVVREHFEALGRTGAWSQLYLGPETAHNVSFRRRLEQALALIPQDACRVLDLGCGPSPLGPPLVAGGMRYVGLDLSAAMLAGARSLEPRALLVQGNAQLPFESSSLDLVVALGFVEYLVDIPTALAEMRRVLRRGGTALISIPKAWHIDVVTVAALAPVRWLAAHLFGRRSDSVRRTYLTAGGLDRLARDAGLQQIDGRHYHYTPLPYPFTVVTPALSLIATRIFERHSRLRRLTFLAHGYLGSYRRG